MLLFSSSILQHILLPRLLQRGVVFNLEIYPLIFCAEKSQETIELLELDKGNIHVTQYLTKMPPLELLQEKLSLAIANAKQRLESHASSDE